MDVSKKTLHKVHSRRKLIEKTNNRLQKSERTYNRYQNKKEHLGGEKKPLLLKRIYNKASKPYELQYHITRTTDDRGNTVYKQGFRIAESSGYSNRQRGVLHKIDSFRKNNIYSDVCGLKMIPHIAAHSRPAKLVKSAARFAARTRIGSAAVSAVNKISDTKVGHGVSKTLRYSGNAVYKAASVTAEGAFRTSLAAESGLLTVKDSIQRRSKAALDLKVRQDAQGDGEKSGILLASNTLAASKGLMKHLHDKRHYKPLQKNLNKRIRVSGNISEKNKHIVRSQNKQFIKSAVISERFRRKTGRDKPQSGNVQYVLTKKKKSKLIYKAEKKEYKKFKKVFEQSPDDALSKELHIKKMNMKGSKNAYKYEKIGGKLNKLQNRKNKKQKKLYKLKNRPLALKAAVGISTNIKGSLRNQAMKDGAADNDAVMAMDKMCTLARRKPKLQRKESSLNKKLNRYSSRERKYHKKSAKKKKKASQRKNPNYNAQKIYKEYAAKKAKRAVRRKKASKFGLAVMAFLTPIMILPLILVSCLGIFANPGSFGFVTGYYGAKEENLTKASEYYQELAYDMNKYVLTVPDEWKNRTSDLHIPSDYTDDPTRFVFGNSDRLASDTTYDYDKHKLYSYLCAFLLTKDDEGSIKNWKFNDETKKVIENLFFDEYEFNALYDNTSHWELRNEFDWSGYYLYENCGWNGTYGYINVTYPDALPVHNVTNENTLFFNVENGEILDYNNNYAATGWYLQNQYYNTNDSAGNTYDGWYDGEECTYGIYNENGVLTIPFPYVIYDENWFSVIQRYDRINECTLYYTVNRKKSFDEAIKDSLMALEAGESLYSYYMTLSTNTEPQYYGMHQVGTSPVYYGYVGLLENNLIGHGFGWEMKNWNEQDCSFNTNDKEHSGISIIQNSGSDVYAMVNGTIAYVGDNYFVLIGNDKDRDNYLKLMTVYCNVDTSGLSKGQKVKKGEVISHVNNRRQEMEYLNMLNLTLLEHKDNYINLIDNDFGCDYLNITCYNSYEYMPADVPKIIDPEIILSLSDKGESSETE